VVFVPKEKDGVVAAAGLSSFLSFEAVDPNEKDGVDVGSVAFLSLAAEVPKEKAGVEEEDLSADLSLEAVEPNEKAGVDDDDLSSAFLPNEKPPEEEEEEEEEVEPNENVGGAGLEDSSSLSAQLE
jgi:hypothetical protein